jgi:5-methylcytosine-specific restriction enzyme subunit McrC
MNAAIPDAVESANQPQGARMIGRIPVRNLWFLMLYASDFVRLSGEAWIKLEQDPEELPDLVAELLCVVVERRLRRNLSSGYAPRKND